MRKTVKWRNKWAGCDIVMQMTKSKAMSIYTNPAESKKSYQFFLNQKNYHHISPYNVYLKSIFRYLFYKTERHTAPNKKLADYEATTTNRHADIHYVDVQNDKVFTVYRAGNEFLWSQENTDTCRPHTCHYHYMSGLHTACVVHYIPDPSSRHDRHTGLHGSRRYRDTTPDRRLTAATIAPSQYSNSSQSPHIPNSSPALQTDNTCNSDDCLQDKREDYHNSSVYHNCA